MNAITKTWMFFLVIVFSVCHVAIAQEAEINVLVQRNKNMNTLKAEVVRTLHRAAIEKDETTKGYFYFQKPGRMCLNFQKGSDMLLMDGNTFLMVNNGKKSVAKGKTVEQLTVLQTILKNILADGDWVDIDGKAEVAVDKQGDTVVLTVSPTLSNAKSKRRMMFSSFVLTINVRDLELKSLRMNERGENYTHYDFFGYVFDCEVNDDVFIPKPL